jgi:hypothetical protein
VQKRQVTHRYRDPLSEVWLAAAMKMGIRVVRNNDAFAHYDGNGKLHIALDDKLDADDCLAQMVFHELCHSLVEGPDSFAMPDWGLDNRSEIDHDREHATLRVQALLAGRYGLRKVLGPTTDFREFYEGLSGSALEAHGCAHSRLARIAVRRAETNPWGPHLAKALAATRAIVVVAADWPAPGDAPSLYRLVEGTPPLHSTGLFAYDSDHSATPKCSQCAWQEDGYCQQASRNIDPQEAACERFELAFDCRDCGACCRSAYHSVTISEGDSIATRHPTLLVHHESYSEVRREGDHCAALRETDKQFLCAVYEDRPTCCRDFANAGQNCITARRRLGLSL